jgi:glycosyltransferase involved in cell wall biosynthesis
MPDAAARIRVVPMAVREAFLVPGGRLAVPRARELGLREVYALFVGNLETRKNLDLLLRAYADVRSKTPAVQLVLAGQRSVGWDEIAATHSALLASDDVVLTGYLPDAEIAALVRGASVFVYPSSYEGFGLPPLEAMACGVPVVAARTAALPETLGGHARMLGHDDPGELARLIVEAVEHNEGVEEARTFARAFTWERTATATLEVYREAIAEVRA